MKVWEEAWRHVGTTIDGETYGPWHIVSDKGQRIGVVGDGCSSSEAAQLAAAAPDMARVLLEVRQLMIDGHLDARGGEVEDAVNACFDSIDAALRKAGVR